MKPIVKNFLTFLFIFLAVVLILDSFASRGPAVKTVGTDVLINQINEGSIKHIVVVGDKLTVTLSDNSQEEIRKEQGEPLSVLLRNFNVDQNKLKAVSIEVKGESGWRFWLSALFPFLVPFFLIGAFIYFMMRQVQGANTRALSFGQSSARETPKDDKNKVTFKDVAGVQEAKQELEEIVDFLRTPKKFTNLGAKIPKGVLLLGPPGVGKTMLARAVAGEANVPFFHMSGSEFVEMFVGVGASRVRDLFNRAKKNAPCIIFVDELDAVGRQRGTGLGGSHDEREQTLNQILVEMDGFDPNAGIIMLAATNRPDVLDPALLRPGRFDRRVALDLPDIKDREAILMIHARNKPLSSEVNLHRVAERTPGFSGADLANLLNEAAIFAARRNKKQIEQTEVLESIEKVLLGPERKSHILSDQERKVTAYHEGGHALVGHSLAHSDPIHKISIISRGRAGGYTLKLPSEDRHMKSRSQFVDELAMMLGGLAAETSVFGEVTTGPSNDLREATKVARRLVTEYGMSSVLGPRTFGEREEVVFLGRELAEQRDYSEKTAELIDKEVGTLIRDAQETALGVLKRRRKDLDRLAALLLEKETIEKEEFEQLFPKDIKPSRPHKPSSQNTGDHHASGHTSHPGSLTPLKPRLATTSEHNIQ